ncbi:hypothetical protein ADUPG1_007504, partial [Aduncisulcus paluster]
MSIAAAATMATVFTGCGSDSSSSDKANGLASNSSNGTGAFTTSTGATGYATKGPLNGFSFSENGTTITFSGGIDSVTGEAPTLNVSTDTELVDEDGNIISNAYTTIAMQFDGNKTKAMETVAEALTGDSNTSSLLKQIKDTQEDAALENKARVLAQFVKSAKAQNEMGVLTIAFAKVSDGNFTKLLETINKDLSKPLMTSAQITAT